MAVTKLRYYFLEKNIYLFGMYYFSHYFFTKSAPFHKEMAEDLEFKGHKFLFWLMFGESAKTTWAKIKVIHCICYNKKKNIGWVAHDLKKSTKQVMSIASELKGNKRILKDFGNLFWEGSIERKKTSKSKTFSEFTSTNGVNVRAISTQISTRGDVHDQYRPDFYVIDDIENLKTARSIQMTKNIIEFLEELLRGVSVDCDTLIVSNRVAKNGVVAWLEKRLDENPNAIIHEVPLENEKGEIAWPSKFVKTIEQAKRINDKEPNQKKHVKSIEQLKHDLGSHGYNREMLLNPIDFTMQPFKLEWIKRLPCPDLDTMDLIIAVDPAISEKQSADFFAVCVAGRHKTTGRIYVFRIYKTKCGITEQVPLMVNFHLKYGAKQRIETVQFQKALAQLIQAEKKNGHYIEVEEYKPVQDKLLRAHAIAPFVERQDVVFCEGKEIDDFLDNFVDFPHTKDGHDDDVDACMSAIEHFINRKREPNLAVA